ncbi:MAG: class A beta-lactamase-related serine hydrolase [Acidobacteria bacterium]|nr:MAG: class A beta-lactamase-related serine hydrolase [Acidobacteriota bacterium]REK01335.1 MAG: class A beta-lactamase-related serine hydrolase [Acidobacteriota bacterium]REK14291.1 MAG: class A beta-lactamase-related serine hydrolase [Acidobacteriota bacterium]REK45006.1 MAG: class A beta-lactamase-related serine hydrolase [Acidobacteriota bacterium]
MNRTVTVLVVTLITFFSLSPPVLGQHTKAEKIDRLASLFADEGHFAGVVIASENGKVIYEKAFGYANADFKIPNRPDTRIGIASITKPMTAVILVRLIEAGKLAPSDKLSKFIPDFPRGDAITVEMLARHRSGIPHRVMPAEMEAVSYTSAEMVEKIKEAKLDFEPGAQRGYSSGGFTVLTRVLEIASGKPYADLLDEYVFGPAEMKDSVDFRGEKIMERRAQDYLLSADGMINAPLKDYSFLIGAGSVFGSARDVHKFGEAMVDGRLGDTIKGQMVTDGVFDSSGRTNGHRAYLEIKEDKSYGYAVLANISSGAFDLITEGIREILKGGEPAVKDFRVPRIIPNPNKDLPDFAGRYARDDGGAFNIVLNDGYLYSGTIQLLPTKPDCFFEYSFFAEVCFFRNAEGKVDSINWKGFGFELKGVKQ